MGDSARLFTGRDGWTYELQTMPSGVLAITRQKPTKEHTFSDDTVWYVPPREFEAFAIERGFDESYRYYVPRT